ncbi:hypothetical protein JCM21900_005146 [Sporobolomyces salmonicolor]
MALGSSDCLAIAAAALLFIVLKAFQERQNVSRQSDAAVLGSAEKEMVSMGIRNLPTVDAWLQIDALYPSYLALRHSRTTQLGPKVTRTLPGYHDHALEVLCEIASFLSVRFPRLFEVARMKYNPADERTFGDSIAGAEAGAVTSVQNMVTGGTFDFEELEEREGREWNPMRVAGLLLQDDLALMVQDPSSGGQYRFVAGSICTAGSWRLRDKLGLTLDEIHFTGQVPQYAEKYQKSMNRFFANLMEDRIVERNNYFFQTDSALAWSTASNGPEEIFDDLEKGPNPDLLKQTEGASEPLQATDVDTIHFRTERQTLRRLPKSKAILFTIRTYLDPVSELVKESGVPGRMASALRIRQYADSAETFVAPQSWPRDVHWYKGAGKYTPVLLPYLDRQHEEQVSRGEVVLDDKGKTQENYPF